VTSAQEGGASLGILSGFVAGNFSAYYIGLAMVLLMSLGFLISNLGLEHLMLAPAVFAFGLVAFGFLGMGPVTIAVDSYGPVTDNAQSVYELSLIEQVPTSSRNSRRTTTSTSISSAPRKCWKLTTARATPLRPPQNQCSLALQSWELPR